MDNKSDNNTEIFLRGGGETGALIRSIDWASTPLGIPSAWPMALKKAVQTMLNTELPTWISWGPDYIQFYNDAFIPSFGSTRHPSAMGTPVESNSQMWSSSGPRLARVMNGESYRMTDVKISLDKNGFVEDCYMDLFYSPIYNDDWTVGGIQSVVIETTDKVNALLKSNEDELKLRSMIEEAPVAICLFTGENMVVELANNIMINVWGKTRDVIGRPLEEAVPELRDQPFLKLLQNVYKTGKPYIGRSEPAHLEVNGVLATYYFDYTYKAVRNSEGKIYGVIDIAVDVTQKVLTLKALEESKSQLDFAIEAAQLGTWNLDPISNTFTGNERLKEWFGLPAESDISLNVATDVIADKDRANVVAAIQNAMDINSGGNYDIEYSIIHPETQKETIVRAKGKALFDEYGQPYQFSGTLQDVTEEANAKKQLALEMIEQKIANHKFQESELFANSVIYNSPVAKMVYIGEEMKITIVNENMLQLIGRDDSILGKTFEEVLPELQGTTLLERMRNVLHTGETYTMAEDKIRLIRFGKPYVGYYSYIYKALRRVSGEIYGIIVTANDITEQVTARQKIEAKEKELRDLILAAPIGICVVSGDPLRVEEVNDRFLIISGKTRSQYQSAPYWEVMAEIAPMFEHILAGVFNTGIKFTSEEHEMVLLRNGVAEKIFATFEYLPVFDNNNAVSKVIILAIEVTHQVETRREIEKAVEQRTKELAESNLSLMRSNNELEQFAYIASHDLQEPVRKISTFMQMLERSIPDISELSKSYVNKINGSTERMTKLIRDVLAFSEISQSKDSFVRVDLDSTMRNIQADYELLIESKGAEVRTENLPIIDAIPTQMTQLFSNLLSNSLKYVKKGVAPLIDIKSSPVKKSELEKYPQLDPKRKYFHIVFSDNGIGFEEEYAERIFNIFQRLHGKSEYEGTGIGLSICRKIVETHGGHIFATAGERGGAVFHILLPQG